MAMSLVLAFDLGASSLRAALVDPRGVLVARHVVELPVPVERLGWSEADPETWWQALVEAADALRAASAPDWHHVRALALSGFTRSQVFIDHEGRPVRAALLWRDTRAEAALPGLLRLCPALHPERAQLSAFHPLARLWWLKHHEPAAFQATVTVLEPKDFLHLKLTGQRVGDSVSCARLAASAETVAGASLFSAAGLPASVLPPLQPPVSVLGPIQAGLPGALGALRGVSVIAMAHDTWASVVGLGAMRAGFAYNLSGTTEVLGVMTDSPARAEGLLTVDWGGGAWQVGGPSQSGGDAVQWLAELLAAPGSETQPAGGWLEALLQTAREPTPVLFLPYLQGERVPYWDPGLRGAFVGLNRCHRAADLAWAVLEGVAFLNRVVLERAEAAAGRAVREIRFGGGGAVNDHWQQVKADVLRRPVCRVHGHDAGLAGAAIAARTALGEYADLEAAQQALVRVDAVACPDPARADAYDALYALFRRAESALAPLSHELAHASVAQPRQASRPYAPASATPTRQAAR